MLVKIAFDGGANIDVDAKHLSDAKVTVQSVVKDPFLNLVRLSNGSPYPESRRPSHSRRDSQSTDPAVRGLRQKNVTRGRLVPWVLRRALLPGAAYT
jgi:hypothetical protein